MSSLPLLLPCIESRRSACQPSCFSMRHVPCGESPFTDPDDEIPFAPDVNTPERQRIRREMASSASAEGGSMTPGILEAPLIQAGPAEGGSMHEVFSGNWELMSIVTLHPDLYQRPFNAQSMCEVDAAGFYRNLALALRWNTYTVQCPRCSHSCNYYRAYFKDRDQSNTGILVEEMELRKVEGPVIPKESLTFLCHSRKLRGSIPELCQTAPAQQQQVYPCQARPEAPVFSAPSGQVQAQGYGPAAGHWRGVQQPGPYGAPWGPSGSEGFPSSR